MAATSRSLLCSELRCRIAKQKISDLIDFAVSLLPMPPETFLALSDLTLLSIDYDPIDST